MSMLKICWPDALTSQDEQATYVHCITGFFLDVAERQGYDTAALEAVRDTAVDGIRAGDPLSDDAERLVGATLVADAHWTVPIITWMPWHYRLLFRVMEDVATEKLLRISKQHADVRMFNVPDFSFADEVELDGRPVTGRVDGRERMLLGASIMHAEWFDYVASENGMAVDEGLLQRSREACTGYYAGEREELPDDVARFQHDLFAADAAWFERAMEGFGFSSFTLRRLARIHAEQAERMEAMT